MRTHGLMNAEKRASVLLALVLAMSGCAGPKADLTVGHKEYPTDVVLGSGATKTPAPIPLPPNALPLVKPIFLPSLPDRSVPATPSPTPQVSLSPVACPTADPRTAPRTVATNRIMLPPAAGTYRYRNSGTFQRGGANVQTGSYTAQSTRTVQNVQQLLDGSYTYEVASDLAGTVTTTTYQLVPPPGETGGSLEIIRLTTESKGKPVSTFAPTPAITLMSFPAEPGDTTGERVATDVLSGVTLTYNATVGQKVRVDACGTPLDTIGVQLRGNLVNAQAVDSAGSVILAADYALATQYGGLSVMDVVQADGTEGGDPVQRTDSSTIDTAPRNAERPKPPVTP